MDWQQADAFIFDVDGTLYDQRSVRIRMALRLFVFYGRRPRRWKELYALYVFRCLRETPSLRDRPVSGLYQLVGGKCGLDTEAVAQTVRIWMFEKPLDLLRRYLYRDVAVFIRERHAAGKTIVIYSDYPAGEKLSALGVVCDRCFVSGEDGLMEQKPSESAMRALVRAAAIDPARTVYVGDRDEKDRVSAEYAGIRYYDIKAFRKIIKIKDD